MREIEFRARWRDTGKIIKDFMSEYLIDYLNDETFIIEQYTGVKDKNGEKSFYGDTVKTREGLSVIVEINGNTYIKGIDWNGLFLLSDIGRERDIEFEIIENKDLLNA